MQPRSASPIGPATFRPSSPENAIDESDEMLQVLARIHSLIQRYRELLINEFALDVGIRAEWGVSLARLSDALAQTTLLTDSSPNHAIALQSRRCIGRCRLLIGAARTALLTKTDRVRAKSAAIDELTEAGTMLAAYQVRLLGQTPARYTLTRYSTLLPFLADVHADLKSSLNYLCKSITTTDSQRDLASRRLLLLIEYAWAIHPDLLSQVFLHDAVEGHRHLISTMERGPERQSTLARLAILEHYQLELEVA